MLPVPLAETIHGALKHDTPERFRTVLHAVIRHFQVDMGMIHRLNPADQHLELVATSEGVPEAVLHSPVRKGPERAQ